MVFFSKYLPIVSFTVAITAFSIQNLFLYPYHDELDNKFQELKKLKEKQYEVQKEYNLRKSNELTKLEDQINYLLVLEGEDRKY